jgi:hypothetical protein
VLKKWFKRFSIAALVLLGFVFLVGAGLIGYVLYNIDDIAHGLIQKACNDTFGVPSSVAKVRLNIFTGHLVLHDLHISNPPKYTSDHFLTIQKASIKANLFSLRSEVVEIPEVQITGIDLNIEEQDDKGNFEPILENIKNSRKNNQADSQPASKQRYIIHKIVIKDITVRASESYALKILASKDATQTYKLDDIELTDIGTENQSVQMEQIVSVITASILRQAANQGLSVLPQRLVQKMGTSVLDLGDTGITGVKMGGKLLVNFGNDVFDGTGAVVDKTGNAVTNAGKKFIHGTGNAVKNLGKNIGGIFDGPDTQPANKK